MFSQFTKIRKKGDMALFIALYFRVCLFGRSVFGVEMVVKQGSFAFADSLL